MNPMPFLSAVMPYLAIAGTFLLILAYDRSRLPERVRKRGTQAEGTVVEIRRDPGSLFSAREGEGEAPVVDFSYPNGSYRYYSTHYVFPSPYQVGDKVRVWYYFRKSKQEVILEDEDAGTLPGTLYRWGIVCCLLGYPFLIRKMLLMVTG